MDPEVYYFLMPTLSLSSTLYFALNAGFLFFVTLTYRSCLPSLGNKAKDETSPASREKIYERRRQNMVHHQLENRDIRDPRVLAAMLKVPRNEFVPQSIVDSAYADSALAIGMGQTISQPYIVAYMTQALSLKGGERVLEVGAGSGYQAAVLASLVHEVFTIEILPELAERAQRTLTRLGYQNIHFRTGDGYQGWPEAAPFDAIIVTAAPDHVPQPLIDQLRTRGRLIIPVGGLDQNLLLFEKTSAGAEPHTMIPVRFVPMTGHALDHRKN